MRRVGLRRRSSRITSRRSRTSSAPKWCNRDGIKPPYTSRSIAMTAALHSLAWSNRKSCNAAQSPGLFLSGNSDCGGVISSTPQPEASIMGNFLLQGLSSNGMYSMRMSLPPHQHQT